jgi:hypothetical protein
VTATEERRPRCAYATVADRLARRGLVGLGRDLQAMLDLSWYECFWIEDHDLILAV